MGKDLIKYLMTSRFHTILYRIILIILSLLVRVIPVWMERARDQEGHPKLDNVVIEQNNNMREYNKFMAEKLI